MLKKVKALDTFFLVIGLVLVILGLLLPKTGKTAMLDVAIDIIFVWCAIVYLLVKIKRYKGEAKKKLYVYIALIFLTVFGIWQTKDWVMDLIAGPQEIVLYDVEVSKLQGRKGLINLHYYLVGNDSAGEKCRVEISGVDATSIYATDEVIIIYYKNTKRLYQLGGTK